MDEQVLNVRQSLSKNYHEAIKVWMAWRQDQIPFYKCVGDMPIEVAIGYEYLANTYGKQDLTPHKSGHDELVAIHRQMINIASGIR